MKSREKSRMIMPGLTVFLHTNGVYVNVCNYFTELLGILNKAEDARAILPNNFTAVFSS